MPQRPPPWAPVERYAEIELERTRRRGHRRCGWTSPRRKPRPPPRRAPGQCGATIDGKNDRLRSSGIPTPRHRCSSASHGGGAPSRSVLRGLSVRWWLAPSAMVASALISSSYADGLADEIHHITGASRPQQLGQGRTRTGQSAGSPSVCSLRFSPTIAPMAPQRRSRFASPQALPRQYAHGECGCRDGQPC
jgi:hypothetical protein